MLYVQDHTLLSISSFVLLCPSLVAVMLCDILFWGEVWTNVFTLDRELKTDQLGEPMSIFFWGWGGGVGGYLEEYGWGVAYRSRNDSEIPASPKTHPSICESSQKLKTWSTLHNSEAAQQVEERPHGGLVGLSLFYTAELMSLHWSLAGICF